MSLHAQSVDSGVLESYSKVVYLLPGTQYLPYVRISKYWHTPVLRVQWKVKLGFSLTENNCNFDKINFCGIDTHCERMMETEIDKSKAKQPQNKN